MRSINTILFDLDGTLLSIDMKAFEDIYYGHLAKSFGVLMQKEKFLNLLSSAVKTMVQNTEEKTNEQVFLDAMAKEVGEDLPLFEAQFAQFYQTDFSKLRESVQGNDAIHEALATLKDKGYTLAIATNPLFPKVAIDQRIAWAGLKKEDFVHVSYFEESHYCKPNLGYYKEILTKLQKHPEECMMVGNDALEDLVSGQLGIKTYLITDHLLNRYNVPIEADAKGTYQDFLSFTKTLPQVNPQ